MYYSLILQEGAYFSKFRDGELTSGAGATACLAAVDDRLLILYDII